MRIQGGTAMPDATDDLPLFSQSPSVAGRGTRLAPRLSPDSSLSAAIRAWGEALERDGRSTHTVKAFTGDLRLLARFVGAGQSVAAIGTHDLRHFLDWMLNRRGVPCSPKTYARRVTSLKSFFRWLHESGAIPADPAGPVPQQTVLSPLPEVLTPEEVEAVRQTADGMRRGQPPDARPLALVWLLLASGVKKGECLGVHRNHVELEAPEGPILYVRYSDVRKRYKERKLTLDPGWPEVYQEYLAQYRPRERVFPWSPRRLEYILEEIGEAAGLKKHLSFDMCRWTCALNDYVSGMDRDHLRQKLGISKIQWREVGIKLDRLAAKR
jgi:integrase/recombinase XerD